ncbi:MAG TPA: radical SAM protein, partial [Myxococcota bacterium]|nr:radical SAM protein [Myxococcota bacterium]
QATESRVNELPLDRVLGELEWAARRGVHYVYLVDANFGIRRRDEDITRHLGELRARLGAPSFCYFHLTKNAKRRNLRTVELLQEAGIGSQVSLSMQDLDRGVLEAIRRDNIDPDDALSLRAHCHERGLPTTNELLLGLPRQTLESVRRTVSQALTPFATDSFFLYPVRLLPNAPLTAEVDLHGLVTRRVPLLPRAVAELHPEPEIEVLVVGSPTMSIADWREAFVFGHALAALHDQALAPHTMRYALWQAGLPVVDFVDGLLAAFAPLRATLERYADAILDEVGTMLPLDPRDTRRWEPIEAAVAVVLAEPDRFFEALRGLVSGLGPLALEACHVDRLLLATDGAEAGSVEVSVDWPGFTDGRLAPAPGPGRIELGPVAKLGSEHLTWFLAHGWARIARRERSYSATIVCVSSRAPSMFSASWAYG